MLLVLALLAASLKEPKYEGKPLYAKLAFGKAHAWLVLDKETLYIDRDGDGDLTKPGNKVAKSSGEKETFTVGSLRAGGKHERLKVWANSLKELAAENGGSLPAIQAALKKDPAAMSLMLTVEAEVAGLKGGAPGGRVAFHAGPVDPAGVLLFSPTADKAPVIRLGGEYRVEFYAQRPTLRAGRTGEFSLVVGCPGSGSGTFAAIGYEGTIPEKAFVKVEAEFKGKPGKELFELKERC